MGLIVPHAIRFLIGGDNRFLVPISAFGGAAFVILCDLLSRVAFAPYEIPVGILLFFNHFTSWKFSLDPTPLEVEMRLYEENVNKTLIQNEERKEDDIDVS